MTAYGIAAVEIGASVASSGAELLAMEDAPTLIEGQLPAGRILLLCFSDMGAVENWYASAAYQQAIPYRHKAAKTHFIPAAGGFGPHQDAAKQAAANKRIVEDFLLAVEQRNARDVDELLAAHGCFWVIGSMPLSGDKTKPEFMQCIGAALGCCPGTRAHQHRNHDGGGGSCQYRRRRRDDIAGRPALPKYLSRAGNHPCWPDRAVARIFRHRPGKGPAGPGQ